MLQMSQIWDMGERGIHSILPSDWGALCRPNWNACKELSAYVVNASQPCLRSPCALGQPQPVSDHPMFALTGQAHYSPTLFPVTHSTPNNMQ